MEGLQRPAGSTHRSIHRSMRRVRGGRSAHGRRPLLLLLSCTPTAPSDGLIHHAAAEHRHPHMEHRLRMRWGDAALGSTTGSPRSKVVTGQWQQKGNLLRMAQRLPRRLVRSGVQEIRRASSPI